MNNNTNTLYDLTGQEAGIVVYDWDSVGVFNWAECGYGEVPTVLSGLWSPVPYPFFDHGFSVKKKKHLDDIRDAIPGMVWTEKDESGQIQWETNLDIVYDENSDIKNLFCNNGTGDTQTGAVSGDAFYLDNGFVIIAPDNWD